MSTDKDPTSERVETDVRHLFNRADHLRRAVDLAEEARAESSVDPIPQPPLPSDTAPKAPTLPEQRPESLR
jgi:hypothetical protein